MSKPSRRNGFRLVGDVAYLTLTDRSGRFRAEAVLDACDLDRVLAEGHWYAVRHSRCSIGGDLYVYCRAGFSLHRFILNAPLGMEVDHKNCSPLDNRRSNLRLCTHAQNQQNRRGAHRQSKSGIRGVYWLADERKWRAELQLNRRKIRLGRFASLEDAAAAAAEGRARFMSHATG